MGASKFIDLLLPAAAFALVAFADMIATVRTFAQKHGYEVDANAELRALGAANMTAGLTSSFPISSSNSRSAVNDSTGRLLRVTHPGTASETASMVDPTGHVTSLDLNLP